MGGGGEWGGDYMNWVCDGPRRILRDIILYIVEIFGTSNYSTLTK